MLTLEATLYRSLGIQDQLVLALAAVWGTCAFVSNAIAIRYLPDRWGRRKMLLAGISCVIATEIYCAVLQHVYQDTDNRVGKGFAILGIYVFVVCYCKFGFHAVLMLYLLLTQREDALINSVTWLYGAEVMPVAVRSKMVGLSAVAHYVVNVARRFWHSQSESDDTR